MTKLKYCVSRFVQKQIKAVITNEGRLHMLRFSIIKKRSHKQATILLFLKTVYRVVYIKKFKVLRKFI